MTNELKRKIDKLIYEHSLSCEDYEYLIKNRCKESADMLKKAAVKIRKEIYGTDIYIRGLIEISNICKNDCLYCGIRKSNKSCQRYRLSTEEILSCVKEGYKLGFRTFVLQGGEDNHFTDELLCCLISKIKLLFPDCAVTLSLGERSFDSYKRLFSSGADRYLLRHETADSSHYSMLHPAEMSFENRIKCLYDLKKIGYQVGCGFIVGTPGQTEATLSKDLKFIDEFKPDMCGIGPFIPHKDTPFKDIPSGTAELTCYILSIVRLIHPPVLLPSTTALSTIHPKGREMGILSGANVVMPNLSPINVRDKYELYNNKKFTCEESAQYKNQLTEEMSSIGYKIVTDRGDVKNKF